MGTTTLTILRWDRSLVTSAMSARMSRRVTAESRARAALTMVPRFTEEHGSSANSEEARRIVSPPKTREKTIDKHCKYAVWDLFIHAWSMFTLLSNIFHSSNELLLKVLAVFGYLLALFQEVLRRLFDRHGQDMGLLRSPFLLSGGSFVARVDQSSHLGHRRQQRSQIKWATGPEGALSCCDYAACLGLCRFCNQYSTFCSDSLGTNFSFSDHSSRQRSNDCQQVVIISHAERTATPTVKRSHTHVWITAHKYSRQADVLPEQRSESGSSSAASSFQTNKTRLQTRPISEYI